MKFGKCCGQPYCLTSLPFTMRKPQSKQWLVQGACRSHRAEWKQLNLEPSAAESQLDQSTQRWNRAEDCLELLIIKFCGFCYTASV